MKGASTPMIRSGHAVAVVVCALGISVLAAGCGSATTGTSARRSVQVSLIAPTDGVTVNAHALYVVGTVDPRGAVVHVAGKRVPSRNGAFKLRLALRRGLTRIRIVATAPGYTRRNFQVSVHNKVPRTSPASGGGASAGFPDNANRVCAAGSAERKGLPQNNAVTYLDALARSNTRELDRLSAISAPPGQAAEYHTYIAVRRAVVGKIGQLKAYVAAGNGARAQQLVAGLYAAQRPNRFRALSLGLFSCVLGTGSG
jgi:hypothetical protein